MASGVRMRLAEVDRSPKNKERAHCAAAALGPGLRATAIVGAGAAPRLRCGASRSSEVEELGHPEPGSG
jgi:hypothetical protein